MITTQPHSRTLKQKLIVAASFTIVLVGFILTSQTFFAAKDRLETTLQEQVQNLGDTFAAGVSYWFKSKQSALQGYNSATAEPTILAALNQAKISGDFDNVFLARPDGTQVNANGVQLPPDNNDPRRWDWYKQASTNPGTVYISIPTVAAATGQNVLSLGKAVQLNGQTIGILGVDVTITDLLAQLKKVALPGDGYAFLINQDGMILAHNQSDLLAKPIASLFPDISLTQLTALPVGEYLSVTQNDHQLRLYTAKVPALNQTLIMVLDNAVIEAPLYQQIWTNLIVLAVVLVLSFSGYSLLCNLLFKPLHLVAVALDKIAHGDGDLTQRIQIQSKDEVGLLANNFNLFIDSLHQLISHVRQQAAELGQQAESSLSQTQQSVSELARQQQEISMVATAVTEMASATQEIAGNAEQTAAAAIQSAHSSNEGKSLVLKTHQSIDRLSDEVSSATAVIAELDKHAQDINSIVATIQGIAEQTNLLALNAAIEAARAGEQGRGFAVVADEVRVLSQRTATSTTEIQTTIETLQKTTQKAVALMDKSQTMAANSVQDAIDASKALEEITTAVTTISDMANQIATAAEEQTQVTGEITSNITAIKDVADDIAHGAQQAENGAHQLKTQASELNIKVSRFTL
jgi:methyl-accepting chemotaxis protein